MQALSAVITVPTAGTPVAVSTVIAAGVGVCKISFQALALNSGASVYLGRASTFSKTTGVDLLREIKGASATFDLASNNDQDTIHPSEYWVDVATSGDKIVVSYWIN